MGRFQFNFSDPADVAAFNEIVASMPEMDQEIVRCRMMGYTQAQIGRALGITQVRVSQRIAEMKKYFALDL